MVPLAFNVGVEAGQAAIVLAVTPVLSALRAHRPRVASRAVAACSWIGDDRPGLGSQIAEAIAGVGINLSFMVAQVIGRKYSCIYGFETQEDAQVGAALIKKASRPRKK